MRDLQPQWQLISRKNIYSCSGNRCVGITGISLILWLSSRGRAYGQFNSRTMLMKAGQIKRWKTEEEMRRDGNRRHRRGEAEEMETKSGERPKCLFPTKEKQYESVFLKFLSVPCWNEVDGKQTYSGFTPFFSWESKADSQRSSH